jgi:hypothetical protein
MSIDLNMDIGSLIKGLVGRRAFTGSHDDNPVGLYKVAIIIMLLIFIISGGYIWCIYLPLQQQNAAKRAELAKIMEMKSQLAVLDKQIEMLRKKLDKSKEQYIDSLSHFGNSEDLGGIYQTVSTIAAKYGIAVMNVKDIPTPATLPQAPKKNTEKPVTESLAQTAPPAPKKPAIDVKEIKVEVQLKGRYGDYIKFKEDLATAETLLKINSETATVKEDKNDPGIIYINMNISTYAIDKKPFQGIITEDEHEKNN